jgi:hypothetical protein
LSPIVRLSASTTTNAAVIVNAATVNHFPLFDTFLRAIR